jgi:shikimate dehydrogenase
MGVSDGLAMTTSIEWGKEAEAELRGLDPAVVLAVIGDPVEHSLSPIFQNAGLSAAGVKGQYIKVRVAAGRVSDALRGLAGCGLRGVNVTIPHKAEALEAMDEVSDSVRQVGGVNTVVIDGGRLLGFSTDGPGLVRAIREEFYVDLKDLRVLLLGAGGGAGRAAAVQCAAEGCGRLVLANRTLEKARALAKELAPYFRCERLEGPTERLAAISLDPKELRAEIENVDLVVNATPMGMRRTDPSPVPAEVLTPNLLVYDMVYSSGKSRLVTDAEAAGARAASGLTMLLHQGALSFELWYDRPAPISAMRAALKKAVQ